MLPGTQAETITAGPPTHVVITPTPNTAGVSTTTNIKLGLQLEDQYNNPTTNPNTTSLTLTLSTSSTKGFFATTNGHTGTLGGTLNVTFAHNVGTGTAYYGDETIASPTITAANGTSPWGTTTVTMTVGTPTTITANSGSGQTATVNTAFINPLGATVTDQFGNPVPGVTVTFTPPASGAA